jgi:hypothetical protein
MSNALDGEMKWEDAYQYAKDNPNKPLRRVYNDKKFCIDSAGRLCFWMPGYPAIVHAKTCDIEANDWVIVETE